MAAFISRSVSNVVVESANKMETEEEKQKDVAFDVAAFSKSALGGVLCAIKLSQELPFDDEDYHYYSSFKGFRSTIGLESNRMRNLMERILLQQGFKANITEMDLDEIFELLIEANDSILERVSTAIDEACGLRKKVDPVILMTVQKTLDVNTSWNRKSGVSSAGSTAATYQLLAGRNVQRPQLRFKDKIDNSSGPFVPIIREKPNAIKQLAIVLEPTEFGEMFSHPYQCELDHLKVSDDQLNTSIPQTVKSIGDTPLVFVDTVSKLEDLNSVLKLQKEFAVDLEHHSYRSFQGFTCLMQISTRNCDYIVDTIELRSELQILNESFTDPRIVKVFHGADKDVEWLQRDLGIYVVNMFDTGQASRVLGLPGFSLAFLLKAFCDKDADKQYQLADWRIRPLPEPMVRYAREDTHYLLYIYDRLKNDLLEKGNAEKNLLVSVYQRSKLLCEKRYVKPAFHSETYMDLYKKSRKVFNARQLYALRELCRWRDATARAEDESTGYVLPNHMLLQISEILPREQQGILACCNPIPPLVRQNLTDVHLIIVKAREQSLVETVKEDLQIEVDVRRLQIDLDNVFHCPHDLRHYQDSGLDDDGPTVLDLWNKHGDNFEFDSVATRRSSLKDGTTKLSALVQEGTLNVKRNRSAGIDTTFQSFCSPYRRYTLVRKALSEMTSDATASSTPQVKSKLVENVRKHFVELVKIYGDAENAPQEAETEMNVKATPDEDRKSRSDETQQTARSTAVKKVVEPIRKKKEDAQAVPKKKTKNTKRKLDVSSRIVREHENEVEGPSTKSNASIPHVSGDHEIGNKQVEVETTATTDTVAKMGKIKKKKAKKRAKTVANAIALVPDDDGGGGGSTVTTFQPFDYSGANFEAFKGGSKKKNKECFDPNASGIKAKKGKRFKNKRRRVDDLNSSFVATGKSKRSSGSTGAKASWPKL